MPIVGLGRLASDVEWQRDTKILGWNNRRIALLLGALLLAVLIAAYIDGGEEALHPISQRVEVPE